VKIAYYIPAFLRGFTKNQSRIELETQAATVAEALAALWKRYPGVRDRVVTEQGDVRQHVNVFVGAESIRYTGGLSTPVSDGVEISIVPAVSGGVTASSDSI
jgi:molybdopterin synthase sulfur carrier subunit